MRNKKERLTLKEDFFTHHKKKSIKRTKRKKRFDVWDGDDSGSNEMRRLNERENEHIILDNIKFQSQVWQTKKKTTKKLFTER